MKGRKIIGWVAGIEALAFALLEGGMVTLGALVAPLLFKSIQSRDLAGRTFGNILGGWFWIGLACSFLLVITAMLTMAAKRKPMDRVLAARFIILLPVTTLIAIFGTVLDRSSAILNSLSKPIDDYPADQNPRLEFDGLHKLAGNLLVAAAVLMLIWLVLSVIALLRVRAPKAAPAEVPADAAVTPARAG